MSVIVYDLVLLVAFVSLVSIFLYKNKKNLNKEGLLILYRTNWGIKLINKVGKENPRLMKFLSYVVIVTGYILMGVGLYFVWKIVWLYVTRLDVVSAIKVPPIMPLVPYLPKMFKLNWLPDFYFIYWIVILAIVAITHEFAHGIFAAYHKIDVKKTGFGFFPFFFPVFLAAFVELDEKKMQKEGVFKQLSILGAGTFANVLTAIVAFVLMVGFFVVAFTPSGVVFDSYAYEVIPTESISGIIDSNGNYFESFDENIESERILFSAGGREFVATSSMIHGRLDVDGKEVMIAYHNAPALKSNLSGAIAEINGEKISSLDSLNNELSKCEIGELVRVKTILDEERVYEIVLEENPNKEGSAWLGVGFINEGDGLLQKINSYKKKNVYYTARFGELSGFIYNLLWWTLLISISVAIVNMIPAGIFDGGRFFYLSIFALTKNKKFAEKCFSFVTYLFLFLIFLIMFFWAKSFF